MFVSLIFDACPATFDEQALFCDRSIQITLLSSEYLCFELCQEIYRTHRKMSNAGDAPPPNSGGPRLHRETLTTVRTENDALRSENAAIRNLLEKLKREQVEYQLQTERRFEAIERRQDVSERRQDAAERRQDATELRMTKLELKMAEVQHHAARQHAEQQRRDAEPRFPLPQCREGRP